jgi:hypothetical protein
MPGIIRLTKRKALLFAVLLSVLLFFLPLINCQEVKVSKKLCDSCYVDYYYPAGSILFLDWDTACPKTDISPWIVAIFIIGLTLVSYLSACLIEHYYSKYRDV